MLINYQRTYFRANGGTLMFRYFDGQLAIPGTREVNWGLPDEVLRTQAAAGRTPALGWCWSFQDKPRTSAEIAEIVLDTLIRHIK